MSIIPRNLDEVKKFGLSILSVGRTGKLKDVARVWIANKNITKSFNIDDTVNIDYNHEDKVITIEKAILLGNHTISSRNGKDPIIDIKNQNINQMFGDIEKVEVLFLENKIVIKVAKAEIKKQSQRTADENTVFELFCGGSTLSHCFKMAGYKVTGGLELEDKYLRMFHLNNPGDEIYTITADIADVSPEDYPKGVSTLLAGIPCTKFTKANLSQQKGMKEGTTCAIDDRLDAEALTFFVLQAIHAMAPKTIVVEEVQEYRQSVAAQFLINTLMAMKYNVTEQVIQSQHTKRKRWAMVATVNEAVNLEDLVPEDNLTVGDLLATDIEDRVWTTAEGNKKVSGCIRKNLGIRNTYPDEVRTNTFTSHGTRHTFPVLSIEKDGETLYSDFTNDDIKNIHGLTGYKLSGIKTLDLQILGQGVTEAFYYLAERIKANSNRALNVMTRPMIQTEIVV